MYALLQWFAFGITNIIDTYTVRKYGETSWWVWWPMMFMGVFALMVSLILIWSVDLVQDLWDVSKLVCSGVLFFFWMIPYTLAIKNYEVSKVMVIVLLWVPVFSYFFGVFLWEFIRLDKVFLGIIILVLGGFFAWTWSYSWMKDNRHLIHLTFLSLLTSFLWSCTSFLFKWWEKWHHFWDAMFLQFVGMSLGLFVLLFVPIFRSSFIGLIRWPKKLLWLMSITETLGIIWDIFIALAVVNAPLFYATLLWNTSQPVMVFFMTLAVSYFFPGIFRENITKSVVYKKSIFLAMMVVVSVFFIRI